MLDPEAVEDGHEHAAHVVARVARRGQRIEQQLDSSLVLTGVQGGEGLTEVGLAGLLELDPGGQALGLEAGDRADELECLVSLAAAMELLRQGGGGVPGFQSEGLAARIRLEQAPEPDLSEAFAALDAGEDERAVELLLDALPTAGDARDDLRRVLVAVLDRLGVEHPLARDARRRMAAALY